MKVLVLNCGSSSIKFQLIDMDKTTLLTKGIVEKIGLKSSFLKLEYNGDKKEIDVDVPEHTKGIEYILDILVSKEDGALKSLEEIDAVGHRVAHGGEKFSDSALVTEEVISEIEGVSDLAPLHNPNNLKGIYAIQKLLPRVPQVAVFDTAFHQTMPDYAYMYGLPYDMYTKYGVRRYGFHGTSHKYVAQKACEKLNIDIKKHKIITCHLGNGASIAAIKNGNSVDTSMGLTPVEGLIMGTRSGDLDLGAFIFIMEKEDLHLNAAKSMINKNSGMYGITGISPDMREIREEAEKGNERADLGLKMYSYRVKKYIGSYAAAMNGVDMIVFTGGIGENDWETRRDILNELDYLGLEFDSGRNEGRKSESTIISSDNSKVKAIVVPTNEELVIARDTEEIVKKQ
jgi:acetate kinase